MKKIFVLSNLLLLFLSMLLTSSAGAGMPLWTFDALNSTTITVAENDTAIIQYKITNQSSKSHALVLQPIQGITQVTSGQGVCSNPFVLSGGSSCTLSLQVRGNQLAGAVNDGPIVCQQGSTSQCYRPPASDILRITKGPAITVATINVTDSPLTLVANGPSGTLTILNTSTIVAATNITSNFAGTALEGQVTETGNNCDNLAPGSSCTLTFTPGMTVVPLTNFSISGTNTSAITAAIQIGSGSTLTGISPTSGTSAGSTGVTLTGTALTGASAVTFDGVAAISFNVVNSTTVTAVTPAHPSGVVDVVIATPVGGATFSNGYTYLPEAIGQDSGGGVIGCLGLPQNNQRLIAARADGGVIRPWGVVGLDIATTDDDGATNTVNFINATGTGNSYAAQLCDSYQVDSQNNTPCIAGNVCYSDWFLPAKNQLACFSANQFAIGNFTNVSYYWTSTQASATEAWNRDFSNQAEFTPLKSTLNSTRFRCARTLS